MNKRNSRQNGRRNKEQSFLDSYADFVKQVERRLEQLEAKVFAFQRSSLFVAQSDSHKPGRKEAMPLREYLKRRDSLVYFLEHNWPELRLAIRKALRANKPEFLKPAFREAKGEIYPFQPEFAAHWEDFLEPLWEFLHSGRYFENPRNIANAMAGLPRMKWKTSWDKGSAHPCMQGISPRAVPDYLRRKMPDRYRALKRAKNLGEVQAILKKRSKDQHMKHWRDQPEFVWNEIKRETSSSPQI